MAPGNERILNKLLRTILKMSQVLQDKKITNVKGK